MAHSVAEWATLGLKIGFACGSFISPLYIFLPMYH